MNRVLSEFCQSQIDKLHDQNRFRSLKNINHLGSAKIELNGKELISFGCNDYLGLSVDKSIKEYAIEAIEKYGSSALSSRLISGNCDLYGKLESLLSYLYGVEASTVFSSGYSANLAVLSLLAGKDDLIILDKLAHNSIIQGAKLSEANFLRFKHNNYDSLEKILKESRDGYKNCIIATESVFSMDGDKADLNKLSDISKNYNCWLMVDYAHDIEKFIAKQKSPADIITGTLSKSLCSLGGYVSGSKELIEYINSASNPLIYSTALPPYNLALAYKALDKAFSEPSIAQKALDNANYFKSLFEKDFEILLNKDTSSQIVPIIIGDSEKAKKISLDMQDKGYFIPAIKAPTVPASLSRLRFSFSALHDKDVIESLYQDFVATYKKIN
jgi:8-amino-7-oxononanoate synthase